MTPSSRPVAASSWISATSAVSTKNFIGRFSTHLVRSRQGVVCRALCSPSRSPHKAERARALPSIRPRSSPEAPVLESLLAKLDEVGRAAAGAAGRVPVLLPVALDQTYDYLLPDGRRGRRPARSCWCRSARRPASAWSGTAPSARAASRSPTRSSRPSPRPCRRAAAARPLAALRRVGGALHAVPARHGGAHDDGRARRVRAGEAPLRRAAQRGCAEPPRMTPARKRALEIAADGLVRAKSALAPRPAAPTGVIDGLVEAGALVEVAIPERRFPTPNPAHAKVELRRRTRRRAAHAHARRGRRAAFSVTLLDGVTGSGKTEVYFEAVARTLEKGRQALIMLPEIALTSQFMDRFTGRFGCAPVEWHSALSSPERARAWRAAATGRSARGRRRPLGAVPALHRSRPDRGRRGARRRLQAGGPRALPGARHGRGARQPGQASRSCSPRPRPPSRATSTPARAAMRSVALPGRYSGAELPEVVGHRHAQATRPSRQVAGAAAGRGRRRDAGRQASRRCCISTAAATRPLTLCRSCGHRFDCPQCTAWLVEHRYRNRLNCHHCGFSLPLPENCPKCGDAEFAGRLRPRRRAHRRGGGRALPRCTPGAALLRPGPRR